MNEGQQQGGAESGGTGATAGQEQAGVTQPANVSVAELAAQLGKRRKPPSAAKAMEGREDGGQSAEDGGEAQGADGGGELEPQRHEGAQSGEVEEDGSEGDQVSGPSDAEAMEGRDDWEAALADAPQGAKKLLKRIHKLVDQRDQERNERLALQARLAAVEQGRNGPSDAEAMEGRGQRTEDRGQQPQQQAGGDWVDRVPQVAKLNERLASLNEMVAWCRKNPDGGEVPDGKGGMVEIDAETAARARENAEAERAELTAERAALRTQFRQRAEQDRQQFDAVAKTEYPWTADESSPEFKEASVIFRVMPQLRDLPSARLAMADWYAGKKAREAKAAAQQGKGKATVPATKPKPAAEPTPVGTGGSGKGGGARRGGDEVEVLAKKQRSSGRVSDLARVFAAKRAGGRK
jgi:hypothetical protein